MDRVDRYAHNIQLISRPAYPLQAQSPKFVGKGLGQDGTLSDADHYQGNVSKEIRPFRAQHPQQGIIETPVEAGRQPSKTIEQYARQLYSSRCGNHQSMGLEEELGGQLQDGSPISASVGIIMAMAIAILIGATSAGPSIVQEGRQTLKVLLQVPSKKKSLLFGHVVAIPAQSILQETLLMSTGLFLLLQKSQR